MAKFPSLPFWTDAWIAKTHHLTRLERGTYFDLLVLMWNTPGCRVPNDDAWLGKHLKMTPGEVTAELRPLISEFCKSDGNHIIQCRLIEVYNGVIGRTSKRSVAAKRRWAKEKDTYNADATKTKTKTKIEESERETRARPVAEMQQKKEVGEKKEPLISAEAFSLADDYRKLVGISDDEIGWVGWPYTVQTWLTQGHGAERILAIGARLAGKSTRMSYHATAVTSELSKPISMEETYETLARYSPHPSASGVRQPWQQRRDAGHAALAKLRATIDAAADGSCEGSGTVIDLNPDARRG